MVPSFLIRGRGAPAIRPASRAASAVSAGLPIVFSVFFSIVSALAAPVAAQAQAQTGTGGGPTSTVTAPNASSVGRVMPRPGAGGAEADRQMDRTERTPQMKADDKIQKGICIGCGAK